MYPKCSPFIRGLLRHVTNRTDGLLRDEVLGLGVVADDGRGRLLRMELVARLLADLDVVGDVELGHAAFLSFMRHHSGAPFLRMFACHAVGA